MTPEKYLAQYRSSNPSRKVGSLVEFLEAVSSGADLWHGSPDTTVTWSTDNSSGEYEALKTLGWKAGADYGSYGMNYMMVWSPHTRTLVQGFILDEGSCCFPCLKENEDPASLPWLYEGECYECTRCHGHYRMTD